MTRPIYTLSKSTRKDKKWKVETPEGKTIHFGAAGYSDFTLHKNLARKNLYIMRHQMNENWTKSGINTAGFWSYWLLWNKPTLEASIRDTERKFEIKIIRNI
jgi:hypothetical protein